jgi:hypothetical protein
MNVFHKVSAFSPLVSLLLMESGTNVRSVFRFWLKMLTCPLPYVRTSRFLCNDAPECPPAYFVSFKFSSIIHLTL